MIVIPLEFILSVMLVLVAAFGAWATFSPEFKPTVKFTAAMWFLAGAYPAIRAFHIALERGWL